MDIVAFPKQTAAGVVDANEKLSATELNQVVNELFNIISSGGLTRTDTDVTQIGQAIARYASGGVYYQDSSTIANSHTLSSPSGSSGFIMPKSYFTGMMVYFRAGATNTGNVAINVNQLGSKGVKLDDGSALAGGEIVQGQMTCLEFDGSNFRLLPWANALNAGTPTTPASPVVNPSFRVTQSAVQTVSSGVASLVTNLTNFSWDNLSAGTVKSPSRITFGADDAGKWLFVFSSNIAGDLGIQEDLIYKNGVFYSSARVAANSSTSVMAVPVLMDIVAGDFVEIFAYHTSGAARQTNLVHFSGSRQ